MKKKETKNILTLKGFYLFTFLGVGSLYPFLSVYMSEVEKLNGYQIGVIMSMGPIIMILFQPVWGILSDVTNQPIRILVLTTLIAGLFGLGYPFLHHYYWFVVIAILVAVFQSAIIPISDSISIKYAHKVKVSYGNIRMYGSLGFGIAVFIMGRLSDHFIGLTVIFYTFFIAFAVASLLAARMPNETSINRLNLKKGLQELLAYKKFMVFLIITFLFFGPNLANSAYFGLFVDDRGGSYTGIGFAFLIAVLSEIPFMKVSGLWIEKLGLLPIMIIAIAVSFLRWMFYFSEPSLWLVYATSFIQGVSMGLFIPAGVQYIRDITPLHITATAITLYSAIANGLGNWFCTFVGGILLNEYSIYTVYLLFSILGILAFILNIWLLRIEKSI